MENNSGEILEAIHTLAQHMDERFNDMESRIATKDYVDNAIGGLKTIMVTKDYLDEKLLELRVDFVTLIHGGDRKVDQVIHKLREKNIFSDRDVHELLTVKPHPR